MSARAAALAVLLLAPAFAGCSLWSERVVPPTLRAGPAAAFDVDVDGLSIQVDASPSTGADAISLYAWTWGDGTPGAVGKVAQHAYAAPGAYSVTLTLTDLKSKVATTTKVVQVAGGSDEDDDATSGCNVPAAKSAHRSLTVSTLPRRLTFSYEGTEAGAPVRYVFSIDQASDSLYFRDASGGSEFIAVGREAAVIGGDAEGIVRQAGGPSFMDGFLRDLAAEPEAASRDVEPFKAPTSWFEITCETFRGQLATRFHYEEHGIVEDWWFDPDTLDVVRAIHVNEARGTDVSASVSPVPSIPPIPSDLPKIPASLSARQLASQDGTDGWLSLTFALTDETEPVLYSELELDLYDEASAYLATIQFTGAERSSPHGSVELRDVGLPGIADVGDVWVVRLAPGITAKPYDKWAESDAVLDLATDEGAAEAAPEDEAYAPATLDGEVYASSFAWTFRGEEWTWDFEVPLDLYDHYASAPFATMEGKHAWDVYVSTPHDDEYLRSLADSLLATGREQGWDDDETLSFALAFVQGLPYTSDDVTTGYDEYPRYPVETLVDGGGDCEDTAILYAAIAQAMGYDAVLLELPGHLAVGVASDGPDLGREGYSFQGVFYAFAETTGEDWRIGEIPPELDDREPARVHTLEARGLLELDWSFGEEEFEGYVQLVAEATNTGSGAVTGAVLWMGTHAGDEVYQDAEQCTFEAIAPGETVTCTAWLSAPTGNVQYVFIGKGDPFVYVRLESEWTTATTPADPAVTPPAARTVALAVSMDDYYQGAYVDDVTSGLAWADVAVWDGTTLLELAPYVACSGPMVGEFTVCGEAGYGPGKGGASPIEVDDWIDLRGAYGPTVTFALASTGEVLATVEIA